MTDTFNTEVQKPETDPIVELFQLDLTLYDDDVYYFVRGASDTPIQFDGHTYVPTDFETEGFELNGSGAAPTPRIRLSVTSQLLTGLINDYNDLIGAKITRIKTYEKFLDGGSSPNTAAHFPLDIYRIERKVRENKMLVEFELSSIMDQQGRLLPGRAVTANYCPWIYRRHNGGSSGNPLLDFNYHPADNKCPYAGTTYLDLDDQPTTADKDRCGKRVSSCKARFGKDAELPYGGFPGAARATIS